MQVGLIRVRRAARRSTPSGRSRTPDVEALDQPIFEPKYVADQFVREEIAVEVAHDRMDFDEEFAVRSSGELYRLDMRINHRPLTCPVATHPPRVRGCARLPFHLPR